jgi:hypothetical protein
MTIQRIAAARRICALGLYVCAAQAFAGFIDERTRVVPADVAASPQVSPDASPDVGSATAAAKSRPVTESGTPQAARRSAVHGPLDGQRLLGEFGPQWDQTIVGSSGSRVPLETALKALQPNSGVVVLEIPDPDVRALQMDWRSGMTAREVLSRFAGSHSLVFRLTGNLLSVTRQAGPVEEASGIDALKRYEVRLSDVRLHVAMQRWAAESGVRLRWDADRHLLISAPTVFEARTALQAIGMALDTPGIAQSEYPLEVCEYPNVPPLLRITRQGEQSRDCPN